MYNKTNIKSYKTSDGNINIVFDEETTNEKIAKLKSEREKKRKENEKIRKANFRKMARLVFVAAGVIACLTALFVSNGWFENETYASLYVVIVSLLVIGGSACIIFLSFDNVLAYTPIDEDDIDDEPDILFLKKVHNQEILNICKTSQSDHDDKAFAVDITIDVSRTSPEIYSSVDTYVDTVKLEDLKIVVSKEVEVETLNLIDCVYYVPYKPREYLMKL